MHADCLGIGTRKKIDMLKNHWIKLKIPLDALTKLVSFPKHVSLKKIVSFISNSIFHFHHS